MIYHFILSLLLFYIAVLDSSLIQAQVLDSVLTEQPISVTRGFLRSKFTPARSVDLSSLIASPFAPNFLLHRCLTAWLHPVSVILEKNVESGEPHNDLQRKPLQPTSSKATETTTDTTVADTAETSSKPSLADQASVEDISQVTASRSEVVGKDPIKILITNRSLRSIKQTEMNDLTMNDPNRRTHDETNRPAKAVSSTMSFDMESMAGLFADSSSLVLSEDSASNNLVATGTRDYDDDDANITDMSNRFVLIGMDDTEDESPSSYGDNIKVPSEQDATTRTVSIESIIPDRSSQEPFVDFKKLVHDDNNSFPTKSSSSISNTANDNDDDDFDSITDMSNRYVLIGIDDEEDTHPGTPSDVDSFSNYVYDVAKHYVTDDSNEVLKSNLVDTDMLTIDQWKHL
jgi:hypothetical protein